MRMRQKERRTIRADKRKYTVSGPPSRPTRPDRSESAEEMPEMEQEQKAKERSGPIEPAEVGRQGSVGSLEGIRKAKVCRKVNGTRKWNRKKDRRDRRTTIEEEEDVEKRKMMTEATGGGRSIGSGETRKVNRDNRKRRKPRRRCAGQRLTLRHMAVREAEAFRSGRKAGVLGKVGNGRSSKEKYGVVKGDKMKVWAGAGTGTKSRKQERCLMGYKEGIRKAEGEPEVPKRKAEDGEAGVSAERDGE
ncbi:hypothetical protein DFH06DRAFT_1151363 [Mycena polygramma]|nr:hypothetical protein DFH06DRAFT_1151363 [Mycena polygramma]